MASEGKGSGILDGGMYPRSRKQFTQGLEIDRLGYATITACVMHAFDVSQGRISGDGHDLNMSQMFLPPRPMNQHEAVLRAKMNVQEHDFREGFRGDVYKPRFERIGEYDVKPFGFQPSAEKFTAQRFIFHDENARLHLISPRLTDCRLL
jgi:hypothetical protein